MDAGVGERLYLSFVIGKAEVQEEDFIGTEQLRGELKKGYLLFKFLKMVQVGAVGEFGFVFQLVVGLYPGMPEFRETNTLDGVLETV